MPTLLQASFGEKNIKEAAFDSHVTYLLESSDVFKIVGFRIDTNFPVQIQEKNGGKTDFRFANLCCVRVELQELWFGF